MIRISAFTLIEAIVMLSLLTAMALASMSLLGHLRKTLDKTTTQSLTIREAMRLAKQLRDETHRSQSAMIENDGKKLILQRDGGLRSEFELRDGSVLFESQTADAKLHDRFQIEPNAASRFSAADDLKLIQLLLRPANGERQEWRIDAYLPPRR